MGHPLQPGRLALGTATASFQIEGASTLDGRGVSIWDTFCERPGAIRDASDGVRACESYLRPEEDVELVAGLGVDWYRFSIAWPRIVPEGTGRVETRGLDYYDRLVDALLARGIAPTATLYHWDLPQPLEDAGGWLVRETAEAFAAYGAIVHERLGDRVGLWASHNEPWCAAYLGYAAGVHAPGRREGGDAHRAAHHLMLGHGLLRQALGDVEGLGIVCNLAPIWPEGEEAREVGSRVDAIRNRVWLDPLVDGAYDEELLDVAPVLADPSVVRDGDLALIRGSADWLGINYYTPVRPALPAGGPAHTEGEAYPGAGAFDMVVREPRTDIGWEIDASGLEELLVEVHRRTGLPIVVTENGAACADTAVGEDGVVDDQDRIDYLRDHLAATERAIAAGADVRGYFVWTLLDNFEWAEGYTKRFGLVRVDRDHADLPRVPKASYHWVAQQTALRARESGSSFPD